MAQSVNLYRLWKKVKRNGHFAKQRKLFLNSIMQNNSDSVIWMHNYASTNNELQNSVQSIDDLERSDHRIDQENLAVHEISVPYNGQEVEIDGDDNFNDIVVDRGGEHDNGEESNEEHSNEEKSDDESDSNSENDMCSIRSDLRSWGIDNQIKHCALNSLLTILRKHFPASDLPSDARSLVRTPRSTEILSETGAKSQYWHYGLMKAIHDALSRRKNIESHAELDINIDGLPMFRSSLCSFWPILVQIHELRDEVPPLIVGIFSGKSKSIRMKNSF